MKRAIIIHGWEEKPDGHWLPWLGKQLQEKGWQVDIPEMPNTKEPKLSMWMETLESLSPNENTVLVGHSLANALIVKYLEKSDAIVKSVFMVAAWDWLIEEVKEFHDTFFEEGFDYEKIKSKNIPITIINSDTDPWIDINKAKEMKDKLNAKFIEVKNAGHFMDRNGYTEFPMLLKLVR